MTKRGKRKKMCECGFPQSSPIPHEHSRYDGQDKYRDHDTKKLLSGLRKGKTIKGWITQCGIKRTMDNFNFSISIPRIITSAYPVEIIYAEITIREL